MSPSEVLAALEKKSTVKLRELYSKQGAQAVFGVSPAGFKQLAKRLGTNQSLAEALWQSGNVDAMILAALIADPEAGDSSTLKRWVDSISFYKVADAFVDEWVVKTKTAKDLMEFWIKSPKEFVRRCGYRILAWFAANDRSISNDQWIAHLHVIMNEIQYQENWAREGMNTTLIAIGKINRVVNMEAMIVAMQVGKLYVDYGDPSIKPPVAMSILADRKLRDRLE